jgi:hypothetical protein
MTDPITLLALAERCEQAAGPDKELDFTIDNFMLKHGPEADRIRNPRYVLPYTASLDAAVTLVPEGRAWTLGQNIHHWYWQANINALNDDGSPTSLGFGGPCNYPALALCAAALRAKADAYE